MGSTLLSNSFCTTTRTFKRVQKYSSKDGKSLTTSSPSPQWPDTLCLDPDQVDHMIGFSEQSAGPETPPVSAPALRLRLCCARCCCCCCVVGGNLQFADPKPTHLICAVNRDGPYATLLQLDQDICTMKATMKSEPIIPGRR